MIKKIVLSEQCLIYGNVSMPKGFEINKDELKSDILESLYTKKDFPSSKNWDMLNTYICDFVHVEHKIKLVNKETRGDIYKPNEVSDILIEADPVDLKHSPDFTCLYGINVEKSSIRIFYDDNRRKNKSWDIDLKNNMFVMFPSTCMYIIYNRQESNLNYIQTITYEYF